jgi:hypothetical protein
MKKKIIGIFVCMLLITISVCTLSASADPESELRVGVFGASIMALRQAGGIIWNDGLDTIRDVQYTFTIRGGYDYGPVTITMTVTLSNAGEVTATSQGFQIGPYTISKTYLMAWC